MNHVNLIGRITKDVELKMTKADTPMVSFTLAVKRKQIGKETQKQTDFFNCVAFGSRAEFLAKFAKKSTLIGVEGRLQSKVYLDENDKRHSTVDVVCESVQILRQPTEKAIDNESISEISEDVIETSIEENTPVETSDMDESFEKLMKDFSNFFNE